MVGRDGIEPPTPGFSDRPAAAHKYAEVLYLAQSACRRSLVHIGSHWSTTGTHGHRTGTPSQALLPLAALRQQHVGFFGRHPAQPARRLLLERILGTASRAPWGSGSGASLAALFVPAADSGRRAGRDRGHHSSCPCDVLRPARRGAAPMPIGPAGPRRASYEATQLIVVFVADLAVGADVTAAMVVRDLSGVPPVRWLGQIHDDVVANCIARGSSVDAGRAEVNAAIHSRVVRLVGSRREIAVRPLNAGQVVRRRGERDMVTEVRGQDGGGRAADGAVVRWVVRMRGCRIEERKPHAIGGGEGIAVGVGESDSGDRPPERVFELGVPGRNSRVGHRDVEERKEPRIFGKSQPALGGYRYGDSIPVNRSGIRPERSDLGLLGGAGRAGRSADGLDLVEVERVPIACQGGWASRTQLRRRRQRERGGGGEMWKGGGAEVGGRRTPLPWCRVAGERWRHRTEAVVAAPPQNIVGDSLSPLDATRYRLAVRNVFVVAHGGERCRPREIEGGLLRRKERNEGDVSGLDRCRASRGASWRLKVDVIRGISPLDPVHGVEDGRVHDREDPSRGRGGCPRRPDRVPSVFIPLGHHIAGRRQWRREAQHGERDRHENTVEEVEVKASMAHDVSPFRLTEYANAVTLGVRAGEGNPGLVSREPPESPSVSR